MNVIYVGTVPPQHIIEEIKGLGSYMDYATLTFQNGLVSGLDYWFPQLRIVSGIRVDVFPKVKKVFFKSEDYFHKSSKTRPDRFVRIVNIPLIKRVFLFFDKRREIKRMLSDDNNNVVISYSLVSSQLLAIASLRKYLFKTCLVIPDLPEYMARKGSYMRRLGKAIDRKLINWAIRRMDTFVLLSRHMAERLPIEGKKWIQMEGIYCPNDSSIEPTDEYSKYHTIMYSGDLSLRYGIKDLLDAFELIPFDDYRLILCGNGDGKVLVKEIANKDNRVKYLGVIDRLNVLALQRGVSVLVNPRHRSEKYTRYSFPSKTMEYLASGTPVIMHHLDCIPHEYDEFINYINFETPESLRDAIIDVCILNPSEAKLRAQRASLFIRNTKNAVVQTRKIHDLICS